MKLECRAYEGTPKQVASHITALVDQGHAIHKLTQSSVVITEMKGDKTSHEIITTALVVIKVNKTHKESDSAH